MDKSPHNKHKDKLKKQQHHDDKTGSHRRPHKRKLTKKEIEQHKAKIQAEKERKFLATVPVYKLPNTLPMIYEIHQRMKHRTPLKVASTCFLLWAVYAGLTSDRANVQLFIPLFNPDPDLGVICDDVYNEERRHKFDYMPPQELQVDKYTKEVMDYVIDQADELTDEQMMELTKQDQAYQYALANHSQYLEPYIIINQYASWVDAVYNQYSHTHHHEENQNEKSPSNNNSTKNEA